MAILKQDLVVIEKTKEMDDVATYIANKRKLFEFPRAGYGDYDSRGVNKIKVGILGELAFLEFILSHIKSKYGDLDAKNRNNTLHNVVKFSYEIVIGKYDGGFDFKLSGKSIDVKTYENNIVTSEQIWNGLKLNGSPLSLFVDRNQYVQADLYVQAFIMPDDKICLAGYHEGLPPLATWMPNPAYTCSIRNLSNIKKILP
jgi:hypothetical protein